MDGRTSLYDTILLGEDNSAFGGAGRKVLISAGSSASDLEQALEAGSAPWVLILPGKSGAPLESSWEARIGQICREVPDDAVRVLGAPRELRFQSGDLSYSTVSSPFAFLPVAVAALLVPPNYLPGLLLGRQAYERLRPLKAVSHPLWDGLIRATQGGNVEVEFADAPAAAALDTLPALAPEEPPADREWLLDHLMACPLPNGEKAATTAFRAGLCQWHDFLDEGHELSQSIEGVGAYHLGDYWHAIMHRREPDYGNSKYWFRRVGPQPIFESLEQRATEILSECPETEAKSWLSRLTANGWDPFAFVDLCEACAADENAPLSLAARAIQRVEMLALLEFNYQQI